MSVLRNRLLMEEKSYDRELLTREKDRLVSKLNNSQRNIFNLIIDDVTKNKQELVFVYGHDRTGKTFLWKSVIYALRSEGKIVLAVASSRIASLLLPSGRTAHSLFKLPLELNDTSIVYLVAKPSCWEMISNTLPVKESASRNKIISSSIVESYLWRSFKLYFLTENMRLTQGNLSEPEKEEVSAFAEWLLEFGDGSINAHHESDPENTSWIDIPNTYRIPDDENGLTNLIKFIYDDQTLLHPTAKHLQEKAIVCSKNDTSDTINAKVMSMLRSSTTTYISNDEASPHGHDGGEVELLVMETTNSVDIPQQNKEKMIMVEPEITNISDLSPTDHNKTIEAIIGNIIGLTIWNEMALDFDVREYESMEKPIIIAVSSCYVTRYNGLQLSGTSATHYYLNPNVAKTYQIRQMYPQLPNMAPLLDIKHKRDENLEKESTRNRFPLSVLLEVDPQNYQRVRFTTVATIFKINTQRRCYCFKAIVNDGSTTTSITCFSDQANTLTRDCNEVLAETMNKDPYTLPPSLKELEGTTHTFQFHFDTGSTAKRPDFILDIVFKNPTLALPAPVLTETPKPQTKVKIQDTLL
ncbi:DNA helicase [Tanacetum coccineum]